MPPTSPLSRHAGTLAMAAGLLMVVAELVIWPNINQVERVATALNPVYQAGGLAYFLGFILLLLALIAVHGLQSEKAGALGSAGFALAIIGTFALGGDLWFETFAVPWLAGGLPVLYDLEPGGLIAIGALLSYVTFAAGWLLFGIASFRAGVFSRPVCVALMIGGVVGFTALAPPGGIPLGLAVAWLGISILRGAGRPAAV